MGTGGPFEHYPGEQATISASAEDSVSSAELIQTVGQSAAQQITKGSGNVFGFLPSLFDERRLKINQKTGDLKDAALLSGGVLRLFANDVETYNHGVDQLNREYHTARAGNFGVEDALDSSGVEGYERRVENAKSALMTRLKAEEQQLRQALDDAGDGYAGTLEAGPSDETLKDLTQKGAFGIDEMPMTGVDIDDVDLREMLENLDANGRLDPDVDIDAVVEANDAVNDLLARDDFGVNGNRDDLERMLDALKGLGDEGAGVDYILQGLDDDELERLEELTTDDGFNLIGGNGLEHWDLIDFHNILLSGATEDQVDRISDTMPSINPDMTGVDGKQDYVDNNNDGDPLVWGDPGNRDLYQDSDGNDATDASGVDQGQVGDCWLMAKMGALANDDPNWVQNHVQQNDNGTITVTLYDDDGNPHRVTMTSDLPVDNDGNTVFAGNDGDTPLWSGYYEKALALGSQHGSDGEDGYGGIEGGWGEDDAELMTGQEADDLDVDFGDVQNAVSNGHPVVVGTEHEDWDHPGFVGGHEFYVEGFDEDGNMVLRNPWGPDEPPLVVSASEFEDHFNDAAALNNR